VTLVAPRSRAGGLVGESSGCSSAASGLPDAGAGSVTGARLIQECLAAAPGPIWWPHERVRPHAPEAMHSCLRLQPGTYRLTRPTGSTKNCNASARGRLKTASAWSASLAGPPISIGFGWRRVLRWPGARLGRKAGCKPAVRQSRTQPSPTRLRQRKNTRNSIIYFLWPSGHDESEAHEHTEFNSTVPTVINP